MKSKKKIFVIQPNYNATSEVWLTRMNEMIKDYIIAIGSFSPSEQKWHGRPVVNLYGKIQPLVIRVLNKFGIKNFNNCFNYLREVKKYINSPDTKIVFVHFLTTAVHFIDDLMVSEKNIIIHCHGFDIFWETKNLDGTNYHDTEYISKVQRLSTKALFIANSEFCKQQLMKINIPEKKIKLKYFGVELKPQFNRYTKKDSIKILYLGRLADFKSPDIVIKSFNRACDLGLSAELIIAGDGQLRVTCELLKRKSIYSDSIKILGSVDYSTAEKLYEEADIYTMHNTVGRLSNIEETFGVSIIEAMSFGLPVVTANSSVIKEIIVDNVTGIIVDQFNVEEHANAFLKLANNPALRMLLGNEGRKRVKEKFTPEQEKVKLFEILSI
jgi:glycosyltransferase involved in cell wall biosynthesis